MTAPAAPRLIGRSPNGSVARLRWQPVEGATDYKLYVRGGGYSALVRALRPVAYWRLGEASGTVAVDEVGLYNGTYLNTPTKGASGLLRGDPDTAVLSATSVGVSAFPQCGTSQVTVAGWITAGAMTPGVGSYSHVSYRAWGAAGGWLLTVYKDAANVHRAQFGVCDNSAVQRNTLKDLPGQGTYFLVGTYDGTTIRVYSDGAVGATPATYPGISLHGTDEVVLGFQVTGGGTAALDDVAIWDRALSATEVASLYTAGTTHPGDATHYGLEDDIPDDDIGSDGWFHYTLLPDDVDFYVALTALNLAGEESALSNALHMRLTGPG